MNSSWTLLPPLNKRNALSWLLVSEMSTSEYGGPLVQDTRRPVTRMSEYNSFDLAGFYYTGLNQDGKRPSFVRSRALQKEVSMIGSIRSKPNPYHQAQTQARVSTPRCTHTKPILQQGWRPASHLHPRQASTPSPVHVCVFVLFYFSFILFYFILIIYLFGDSARRWDNVLIWSV